MKRGAEDRTKRKHTKEPRQSRFINISFTRLNNRAIRGRARQGIKLRNEMESQSLTRIEREHVNGVTRFTTGDRSK